MGYRFDSFDPDGALLAAEEQDDGSYWGRHWRGHLPLAQTYWLNGFLTNMVIAGLGLAFMALEHTGRSLRLISVGFLLYVMLALIARGWSLVGIWRSAGRHAARGGTVRIKAGHPPLADKAVQHVGGETIAGKSTGEHHGRNLQQPAKKHDRYGGKLRL